MKGIVCRMTARILALCLAVLLVLPALPVSAAEAADAEVCTAEKVTVILTARAGISLARAAAEVGLGTDEFALTEAGASCRGGAEALLDRILAIAADAAHCAAETGRWTAALVGLSLEVDAGDLPYLRAAGDLAAEGLQFDVHLPAHYLALEGESAVERTVDAAADSAAPDLVVDVTEAPMRAAGDGTVIAILDSGFDADAAWLSLPEGASPALAGEALDARLALVGRDLPDAGQDKAKVPFLYDYTDSAEGVGGLASHGTRVAALAAANHGSEYDGTAPGAQVLLMKVFGDALEAGVREHLLLSAIDDALLLGADVINLSLGFPAGDGGEGAALAEAVAAAQAAGVGIVAAAGNGGETGVGSFFYSRTGGAAYPTAHPDRGTVAAPASLPGVIAVGAAVGSYGGSTVLLDADGNRIAYSDTCAEFLVLHDIGDRSFADLLGGAAFDYVAVPGVGAAADYAELNVVGRVALVERGEISFSEKTLHAAAAGAIGVIVYDNDPETDGAVSMQLDEAVLPAIFINIADGKRLAEAGAGRLSFPDRDPSTRGMSVKAVSEFSSRGMGDDFSFAPELVALGQSFVGLSADGTIAVLEGSSYAAPQAAGALAALMGSLREAGEKNVLATARTMLMNSADPLTDVSTALPVSVRAQGAGVLDPAAGLTAPMLLRGNADGAVTAVGVGARFAVPFTAENRTDAPLDVTLTPTVYADAYGDPLAGEAEENRTEASEQFLALCGYSRDEANLCVDGTQIALGAEVLLGETSIRATGAHITLAPGEVREITLTVVIDPDEYAAYAAAFPNGFVVEGRVKAEADGQTMTLPWAVFCGDWHAAPLVSPTAYADGKQLYLGQAITARLISGYEIVPGELQGGDPLQNGVQLSAELAAINPHGLAEPLALEVCLLRNVARYTVTVTDEVGEVVYTAEGGGLRKAYRYNGAAVAERIPLWDGSVTDNPKFICPDGHYAITLTLYGEAGGEQTITLSICLDSTVPVLESARFRNDGEALMLDLTFSDAEYVRALQVLDRRGTLDYDYSFFETVKILPAGRGASLTLSVDATGLYQPYFYVLLTDYAYNVTTIRIDREQLFIDSGVH